MMARSAADEEVDDRAMRVVVAAVPATRPADDLELVLVPCPDDVTACIGEHADDVEISSRRGPVHRRGAVAFLQHVGIDAARQQKLYGREAPMSRGDVEQRVRVWLVPYEQGARMGIEQRGERGDVAVPRRREQSAFDTERVDVCFQLAPTREAVRSRDLPLSVGQLRGRVAVAQLGEPAY